MPKPKAQTPVPAEEVPTVTHRDAEVQSEDPAPAKEPSPSAEHAEVIEAPREDADMDMQDDAPQRPSKRKERSESPTEQQEKRDKRPRLEEPPTVQDAAPEPRMEVDIEEASEALHPDDSPLTPPPKDIPQAPEMEMELLDEGMLGLDSKSSPSVLSEPDAQTAVQQEGPSQPVIVISNDDAVDLLHSSAVRFALST